VKYAQVYSDGEGNWIFATRVQGEGGLQYGVHVNPEGKVSAETPIASIAAWLPYSDFKPFKGDVPAPVKAVIESAPEPAGEA
jgi:hypothetical protein